MEVLEGQSTIFMECSYGGFKIAGFFHGEIIVIIMGKSWEEDRKIMDSYGIRLEVLVFRNETTPNFDLLFDIPIQQGSVGMVYYR